MDNSAQPSALAPCVCAQRCMTWQVHVAVTLQEVRHWCESLAPGGGLAAQSNTQLHVCWCEDTEGGEVSRGLPHLEARQGDLARCKSRQMAALAWCVTQSLP